MQTACGSAAARGTDTDEALGEALGGALAALEGRTPDLVMVFASPQHALQSVLAAAESRLPSSTLLGCSSAGELTGAGKHEGIAVFAVAWGDAQHRAEVLTRLDEEGERAASALTASHARLLGAAEAEGQSEGISLVLGDGLNPAFESLVAKLRQRLPPSHGVVGGGAGDGGQMKRTFVGQDGSVASASAVAVHVASASPWGVGVGRGATIFGERMTVTKARGNVVYELDGEPTLVRYRRLASERGVPLSDEASLRQLLVEYELGIHLFDEVTSVRAGVATADEGGVVFAGEVPEGATVSFVHGDRETYLAAAREAAVRAREGVGDAEVAGVLLFSCVTRGIVLGERYDEEIDAVRRVFGDVPIGGFLSYGEVARVPGKLDGYHNNTLVVVAIPR